MYNKILKLCAEKNMSIRKLEREAGLKNGAIGKWKASSPRVENLQTVASVLGVSVDYLLSTEEGKTNEKRQ